MGMVRANSGMLQGANGFTAAMRGALCLSPETAAEL